MPFHYTGLKHVQCSEVYLSIRFFAGSTRGVSCNYWSSKCDITEEYPLEPALLAVRVFVLLLHFRTLSGSRDLS